MRILLTGFKNTSSEKLIKCFDEKFHKLVLANDKSVSEQQLKSEADKIKYDFVISFGQKPVMKNKLAVELCARNSENILYTEFDYDLLVCNLKECGLSVKLSENAGTSFCNNIYRFGLEYFKLSDTRMLFVHIPFEKNISDFEIFSKSVIKAVSKTFYT